MRRQPIQDLVTFRRQWCSHTQEMMGRGRNRNESGVKQGHFYLQAKKLGHVDCRTTWRKFYDFAISSKWV